MVKCRSILIVALFIRPDEHHTLIGLFAILEPQDQGVRKACVVVLFRKVVLRILKLKSCERVVREMFRASKYVTRHFRGK